MSAGTGAATPGEKGRAGLVYTLGVIPVQAVYGADEEAEPAERGKPWEV